MTKDDYDVFAVQSGGRLESWMTNPPKPAMWYFTPEALDKFAALVAAREREVVLNNVRPVAVEAIRAATGCPDLIGRDGKHLVSAIEDLMRESVSARGEQA